MASLMKMNFSDAADLRQIRLGLPGVYNDVTSGLDPLPIYIPNIPKSSTRSDIAKVLEVEKSCVTLDKVPRNSKSNVAHIKPQSWNMSDYILGELAVHADANKLAGRTLIIKQAYDVDPSLPSHSSYKIHKLSEEDFDLSPACKEKPSMHCLNDDVLINIFGFLDLKEKLRLEAVCRRWQALIYTMEGRRSTVDLNADDCPWRTALPPPPRDVLVYRDPPKGRLQKYKSLMYKMLILTGEHLTSLHLDEHRCYVDINIVAAIGKLSPNLEVLSLRFSKKRAHFTSLRVIFAKCTKLKTLCLDTLESSKHLFNDLRSCKSLEVLRLSCIRNLCMKGQLKLPLRELSLADIIDFNLNFRDILQPNLRTFRLFHTFEMDDYPAVFTDSMLTALLKVCPDLTELQVAFNTGLSRFHLFKNLKTLHVQLNSCALMLSHMRVDLPAVEDLRLELFRSPFDVDFDDENKYSIDLTRYMPSSVKTFTLPTLPLDDASYKSLLTFPNLERIFFKDRSFSVNVLKKFVSQAHIVEIGAGMLDMDLPALQELASLRKEALAGAHLPPLVLHLPRSESRRIQFRDPYLKIVELRGEAFLYDRIGSNRLDNEWVDFGLDFVQHEMGQQYLELDCSDYSGNDFFHNFDYDSDQSADEDHYYGFWDGQDYLDSDEY